MIRPLCLAIAAVALTAGAASPACAGPKDMTLPGRIAFYRSQYYGWHDNYYEAAWGTPVALVVPPTAGMHTEYTWGVSGTRIYPIRHQFGRAYPGPGPFGGAFQRTPAWPSDTRQFGAYYVRGPW